MQDPVHFSVSQKKVAENIVEVVFSGKIDAGWHVYSTGLPAEGPISATITTETADGAKADGKLGHRGKEVNQYDNMFGMNLRYFENSVTFVQKYKITGKTYHIKGYLEYGACNDEMCMPPTQVEFDFKGEGPADFGRRSSASCRHLTARRALATIRGCTYSSWVSWADL